MMEIRTRFAPSPTGYMHLGNAWIAFLNWWWTRQHKGKILLRIEDIDKDRCHDKYISALQTDLEWLGIDWDEDPGKIYSYGELRQSKRSSVYEKIRTKWEKEGVLYPCFCSRARLQKISSAPHLGEENPIYDGHCRNLSMEEKKEMTKPPSWRIKIHKNDISFNDMFLGMQKKFLKPCGDDFVIFRADGAVSYQLAAAADDGAMGVTHVFRGNDLLPSTFYQICLIKKLEYPIPTYGHLPLLVDEKGIRLSKRQKGITIAEMRDAGVTAPEIIGKFLLWAGVIERVEAIPSREVLHIPFASCRNLNKSMIKINNI